MLIIFDEILIALIIGSDHSLHDERIRRLDPTDGVQLQRIGILFEVVRGNIDLPFPACFRIWDTSIAGPGRGSFWTGIQDVGKHSGEGWTGRRLNTRLSSEILLREVLGYPLLAANRLL